MCLTNQTVSGDTGFSDGTIIYPQDRRLRQAAAASGQSPARTNVPNRSPKTTSSTLMDVSGSLSTDCTEVQISAMVRSMRQFYASVPRL